MDQSNLTTKATKCTKKKIIYFVHENPRYFLYPHKIRYSLDKFFKHLIETFDLNNRLN